MSDRTFARLNTKKARRRAKIVEAIEGCIYLIVGSGALYALCLLVHKIQIAWGVV